MRKIIEALLSGNKQQQACMLVTIVDSHGSAPRKRGACMVVQSQGRAAGTIGGGTLEYQAVSYAMELLQQGRGEYHAYGLTEGSPSALGMVCGGAVDVLFSYIPAETCIMQTLQGMQEVLSRHGSGWLVLPFQGMGLSFFHDGGSCGATCGLSTGELQMVKDSMLLSKGTERYYVRCLQNVSRVFVFGGGHLAQELVPLLAHVGFRCIVTDDRPEYAARELFPAAEEIYVRDFEELAGNYEVHPDDYIIGVTRGHAGDFAVERFALGTPAGYIGIVGSRRKIAFVNEKLRAAGFSEEELSRVTAPIGLPIGSETPAEIAVSIAAQLIQIRAARKTS